MSNNFRTTEPSNRCAHYGRSATEMHAPAALEEQERVCRDFATRNGWLFLNEHVYRDAGISGTSKFKRKGLAALEAAAQKRPRPFDYVLFDDVSRLSRNLGDVPEFVERMEHYGIKVRFVSQNLDSSDETFHLLLTMFGMVYEQQSAARLRSRIHSAQKGRMREAFTASKWPYGYSATVVASRDSPDSIGRALTKETKLEINERDAEVVRRIFQLYADGHSMYQISLKLNVENIPSPQNSRSVKQRAESPDNEANRVTERRKKP
jgi:site-specific DNA recombinase